MIKVSDYIFDYFLSKGIDTIFCVSGGASAHLLNSVKEKGIKVIHCYTEQACAMAADGYARIANKPAIVLVTNGPGSTNTITGILGAYQDSIPMIIISGQVPTNQIIEKDSGLRQLGVQECDIISIVKSITKFAKQVSQTTNGNLSYDLSKAYNLATTGRKGPVWLEIPLDIQSTIIDKKELSIFHEEDDYYNDIYEINQIIELLAKAKKPLIIAGNGIHLSQTENKFHDFLSYLNIPVITTWNAKDLFNYEDPKFIGSFGLLGERAGNLAVQDADLLLILGSRLSIPNIGYNTDQFSPKSIKIMVDIDENEIKKKTLNINFRINEDLDIFFDKIIKKLKKDKSIKPIENWRFKVSQWKKNYPVFQEEYKNIKKGVNSYHFIEELSKNLNSNHIIVTDMGTSFTCTMQAIKMNGKARLFTSSGTCSMGFGLPGAIGAYFANPKKDIILIAGDGGFQMNIQELQTIRHHNIPIKIFILNNNGYSAISLMQDNLFNGNYIGSTKKDVSSPDFIKIGNSYGISSSKINDVEYLPRLISWILEKEEAALCEVSIPENQPLLPRVQSRKDESGKIISNTLDNMFPYIKEI